MKKVLIFSTAYFPFVGGAEIALREITNRFSDFNFDMITALMDNSLPRYEKIGNVNIHRIGIGWAKFDKYWLAFRGYKLAQKLHKKKQYNLIWSMMASYNGFAALFFKKKNNKIPFLLTLQEGDEIGYILKRVGFFKKQFKEIFQTADYIQCISNYLADWTRDMGAKGKIRVVPNGVDLNKFRIKNEELRIRDFREKLGFNENDKVVFTASRLVKKNGIDALIKAMNFLPKNYKLLIAGTGEEGEGLKNLTKELELEERVAFLGFIAQEDLPFYYQACDVFCRPSLSEGQGIAFLEAMAAGIPVVATPVGGIVDFLKNGETGLFCEVDNPKNIAEKIKLIGDNGELKELIVKNAFDLVKENYNWEIIVKDMGEIFENLTDDKKTNE